MSKEVAITLICAVLAVILLGTALGSCSVRTGKTFRTMFEDTETKSPPETVIVEVPVTVIVTVTVEGATSVVPVVVTGTPGTSGVTESPVTTGAVTSEPVQVSSLTFETVEDERTVASSGGKSSTMLLRYPRIGGMTNSSVQDKVNSLLVQIAEVRCGARMNGAEEALKAGTVTTLEVVKCEVTFVNANILSVRSAGQITYSDGTETEKFIYCNVVNLSTGKDIAPKNIYTQDGFAKVLDLFRSGAFSAVSVAPGLETAKTRDELVAQYRDYVQYSTMYPATYFTADSLCICIEVESAYGYWAEYSVPLDRVADCFRISPLS